MCDGHLGTQCEGPQVPLLVWPLTQTKKVIVGCFYALITWYKTWLEERKELNGVGG